MLVTFYIYTGDTLFMKLPKIFLLLLTTLFVLNLTACTPKSEFNTVTLPLENTENETTDQETETPSTEVLAQPEVLRFVDAHGEWFETEIISSVQKHPYNWNFLTNDETGISYADKNYRIVHGIDVSKWQGAIDWEKVIAAGYEFVILRIGYRGYSEAGGLAVDEMFYRNIEGAQSAGLDVGVYFFSQAINEAEALEEAEFVLNALEGYTLQFPIVYDPELIRDQPARTNDVTGEQFTKNTIVFCEAIKAAGYEPMIYSNMIWEAFLFDMTQLEAYPFWYADYEPVPQTPYHFVMWQYTETGTVDGISGPVDLNILFEEIE